VLQLAVDAPNLVHSLTLLEPPPVHVPSAREFRAICTRLQDVTHPAGVAAGWSWVYGLFYSLIALLSVWLYGRIDPAHQSEQDAAAAAESAAPTPTTAAKPAPNDVSAIDWHYALIGLAIGSALLALILLFVVPAVIPASCAARCRGRQSPALPSGTPDAARVLPEVDRTRRRARHPSRQAISAASVAHRAFNACPGRP
jgi:hypothetical protein